jgi:hypothetical protein
MPKFGVRVFCAVVCVLASVAVMQAVPILSPLTVYNTGAATPGTPDPNYVLIGTPANPVTNATAYVVDEHGFPIATGQWDTADYGVNAKWIAPQTQYNGGQTDVSGNYVYQTSFVIPVGFDPTTVILWGITSSDNCTQGILINGTAVVSAGGNASLMVPGTCGLHSHSFEVGGTNSTWQSPTGAYLATSTVFHPGLNTIQFVVNNAFVTTQNPTGLIVWFQGAAGMQDVPAPEASTAGLLALGLAALALLRRKFFA